MLSVNAPSQGPAIDALVECCLSMPRSMLSVNARSQEPVFDARFEGPPFANERAPSDKPKGSAVCCRVPSPIHGSPSVFTSIARFRRPALKARAEGPLSFDARFQGPLSKARFEGSLSKATRKAMHEPHRSKTSATAVAPLVQCWNSMHYVDRRNHSGCERQHAKRKVSC
jgi:hypothetical protein